MGETLLSTTDRVAQAIRALQDGQPILLYDADGREEETDMVYASEHVNAGSIGTLRTQAGGLICTTVSARLHQGLGLPYLADVLKDAARDYPILGRLTNGIVPYEQQSTKPSFGLSINHRETFTGVTDADRALTIARLGRLARRLDALPDAELAARFSNEFKTPGHVFLLNAHPKLLDGRQGHTELSTALMELAGLAPSATICEMMNGVRGRALSKADAIKYATLHGRVFLAGSEVVDAWQRAKNSLTPSRTSA